MSYEAKSAAILTIVTDLLQWIYHYNFTRGNSVKILLLDALRERSFRV